MAMHTSKCWCVWHHCKDGPQVDVMEKSRWRCGDLRCWPDVYIMVMSLGTSILLGFMNNHCFTAVGVKKCMLKPSQKRNVFWGCSTFFLAPTAVKEWFHQSQWNWGAERHHHDIKMWQIPRFSWRRTSPWTWKLMKTLGRFPGRSDSCVCVISEEWEHTHL